MLPVEKPGQDIVRALVLQHFFGELTFGDITDHPGE
jgi:hypothetical protein